MKSNPISIERVIVRGKEKKKEKQEEMKMSKIVRLLCSARKKGKKSCVR